jgi:uncharacterized membrane protein YhaH (DUF805 family)
MFKNPFSFEGRIRRTEYGLTFLIFAAGRVFLTLIFASSASSESIGPLLFITQLPLLWFLWAQGAKRCHDVGWNGWYQLIPLVPIYLVFASGHEYENEYGEDPKLKTDNF